ncbi:TetR/AcrR family transcriptional regulator [Bacillus sp. Bva_UNVM-123]|uniref:TetR/AcrR family transcriptional regulator n=1 Tax=Bacillus sp. Bva_UNVM-123 TaxID=2829798 RepID=UPI00391F996F
MQEQDSIIDQLLDKEGLTDKQKSIILAAIETFSEKGYASTSTSEIAKKAGVAEGTIFRHYKTKKDLLLNILAPLISKIMAPFLIKDFYKVLDHHYDHFEDFLRAMLQNRITFLKYNMPLFKILIQEIPFHPDLKEEFIENIAKKIFERYHQLVLYYQQEGQIIEIPPYSVIRMTFSVLFGYLVSRYLLVPEADWDDEQEIEITLQFIMYGLVPR